MTGNLRVVFTFLKGRKIGKEEDGQRCLHVHMWLDLPSAAGPLQPAAAPGKGSFASAPVVTDRSYSLQVAMPTGNPALKIGDCALVFSGVGESWGGCCDGVREMVNQEVTPSSDSCSIIFLAARGGEGNPFIRRGLKGQFLSIDQRQLGFLHFVVRSKESPLPASSLQ